jgi:hypothetical protein
MPSALRARTSLVPTSGPPPRSSLRRCIRGSALRRFACKADHVTLAASVERQLALRDIAQIGV